MQGPQNNSKGPQSGDAKTGGSGGGHRRRRNRGNRGGAPGNSAQQQNRSETAPARSGTPNRGSAENRNREFQNSGRNRRSGRSLTTNQILVKYDNLLEQHLITRRKYYEYFNRVDDRQLRRLEKNFFDSIEHLRRFEANLESWQREALEKRKTERYKLDLTYSNNRGWNPQEVAKVEVTSEEIEDPHFKDSQKEAFDTYREDTEESQGTYEDYLKAKGLA